MSLISPVYQQEANSEENQMKFISCVLVIFATFNICQAAEDATCACYGLASNFPGVSLVCDNKIVDRTLFYDGDVEIANRVCKAAVKKYLGSQQDDVILNCQCLQSPSNEVLLVGSDLVVKKYTFTNRIGNKEHILAACQSQLNELKRVNICR